MLQVAEKKLFYILFQVMKMFSFYGFRFTKYPETN